MATARRTRISEGSCWQCRKKRVKCDLSRPSCGRCGDDQCSYGPQPVKWVGGTALRGRNAPGMTADAGSSSSSLSMVTTSGAHPRSLSMPTSARRSSAILLSPSLLDLDEYSLVGHFSTAVLPRFQLGGDTIPVDWEVVNSKDAPLQQIVLAVARSHHSFLSKCGGMSGTALVRREARHAAITSFRQRLALGVESDEAAKDLFTITILLCMLDGMIEPSKDLNACMYHLKGGFAMLNRWTNTTTRMLQEQGLRAHLLSVFATMDLVHAFLSGETPYFASTIWPMFGNVHAWWGKLSNGDRFLALLDIHTRMATLGSAMKSQSAGAELPPLIEESIPAFETALQATPNGPYSLDSADLTAQKWDIFCTFYQISGLIYLERALRRRPLDDDGVQALTQRGVSLLAKHVLPGMLSHCVILPILVIGAHCIAVDDQRIISRALSPSLSYLSFGNLPLMNDFLNSTWAENNMQASWWGLFGPIADKTFLF